MKLKSRKYSGKVFRNSYAGITRIRFKGYILRPEKPFFRTC